MQMLIVIVILVVLALVYYYRPSLFGFSEGFMNDEFAMVASANGAIPSGNAHGSAPAGVNASPGAPQYAQNSASPPVNPMYKNGNPQNTDAAFKLQPKSSEGFADLSTYQGPAQFGSADAPAGCYPRDQLTPSELLPKDMASVWAEQNPMGPGSLKGKNFLSAGALIGVNTVGQSMRNANLQVRSEPPNPQVAVSIFNQTTISPDISHRPLEIGA
jgi:hypothetical protein